MKLKNIERITINGLLKKATLVIGVKFLTAQGFIFIMLNQLGNAYILVSQSCVEMRGLS